MRGYPGSRGTGGKTGINPNKPPADQTTFETTDPLPDPDLPPEGLRLTALPLVDDDITLMPPLIAPVLDINELKGNLNPNDRPPLIELPLKEDGRLKSCKFIVMDVKNSNNLCLRTLDYDHGFKSLEKEITTWYSNHTVAGSGTLRMMDVINKGYYAAEILMPHQGRFCWTRVCATEDIPVKTRPRPVEVAAIDYGITTQVPLHKLSLLRKTFREAVPQVGLIGELKKKGLKHREDLFEAKLKEVLPGKIIEIFDGELNGGVHDILPKVKAIFFMESGDTVQGYVESMLR